MIFEHLSILKRESHKQDEVIDQINGTSSANTNMQSV